MKNEKESSADWLENILIQLRELDQQERNINVKVLELLWEIERRKAYSIRGYDGLYTFCLRELHYTESQAYQRLQAMRAVHENPEIKDKIESGKMSISTVAQVHAFLRQEEVSGVERNKEEKLEVFSQFEDKTVKEVKKGIAEMKGEQYRTLLTIELDEEAEHLWQEVRGISAHASKGDALLCFKIVLKDWLVKKTARSSSIILGDQSNAKSLKPSPQVSRYVPVAIRKEVFARDQGKCVNCNSTYAVQIEHILPFSQGGTHDLENLKLLCRNCNLHQGIKEFGLDAMNRSA